MSRLGGIDVSPSFRWRARLFFLNRLGGADVNTAAAIIAFLRVDHVALGALGDSPVGAGALARAAIDAFIGYDVRHGVKVKAKSQNDSSHPEFRGFRGTKDPIDDRMPIFQGILQPPKAASG